MVVGADGAAGGDGEGHREPVIAGRVDGARRAAAGPRAGSRPGYSVTSAPIARNPRASALIRSLSLTRSSAAPRTSIVDPSGSSAPSAPRAGSSSMTAGTSSGSIAKLRRSAAGDRHACRSARPPSSCSTVTSTVGAGPAQDVEQRVRDGLRPTPSIWIDAAGECPRPGRPRRRRRKCRPAPSRSRPLQALAAVDADLQAVAVDGRRRTPQGPLRMIPCGRRLDDDRPAAAWRPASSTLLFTWALGTSGS